MEDTPFEVLLRQLIAHMKPTPEWASLALVFGINDQGMPVESYGYAFVADGPPMATSVKPRLIKEAFIDYLRSVYTDDQQPPVKLLIQFDSISGRYEVTFEDNDRNRWAVTPRTLSTVREELRPKFD